MQVSDTYQLSLSVLLLLSGLHVPLVFVVHVFLHFVNALQRNESLIKQKGGIVHEHVDELDKVIAIFRLVDDGKLLHRIGVEGLENNTNVVAYRELVIEFGRSAGCLHIGIELHQGSHEIVLGQGMTDNLHVKRLQVGAHNWARQKDDLNKFGCQIGIADIVGRAYHQNDEYNQIAHVQLVVIDVRPGLFKYLRTILNDKNIKVSNVLDIPARVRRQN